MTLSERLQAAGVHRARPGHRRPSTSADSRPGARRQSHRRVVGARHRAVGGDALTRLKDRAATAMFERMGARLNDPTLSEDQLHALVRTELSQVVEEEKVPLTTEQRQRLIRDVQDDVLGHRPAAAPCSTTRRSPRSWSTGRTWSTSSRTASCSRSRRPGSLGGAPAAGHRAHRLARRSPHRRVVAAGRRPAGRRLPGQRGRFRRWRSAARR